MNEIDYKEQLEYLQRILRHSVGEVRSSEAREVILMFLSGLKKISDGENLENIEYLHECI